MLKYWIWLTTLRGLGNQTILSLLQHFGGAEDVFYADEGELLLVEGMTRQQAAILADHDLSAAERVLADCRRLDLRILTIRDAEYPWRLKNIYDPPCVLYVKGRLPAIDEEAVMAIVGTRSCTPYGISCAETLGYGLSAGGAVVVSGLARGIDSAAIRGALRAGGTVVGVLGNGIDVHYPHESGYLYEDVAAAGALISEYPPGTGPIGAHFPARNRIMSGLSVATVVVEADEHKSGAMITARTALEQGRDVFAVPGPITTSTSSGCIRLIQEGAGAVMDAADILREYEARFPDKIRVEQGSRTPPVTGYQARRQAEAKPTPPTLDLQKVELTDDQIALLRCLSDEEPIQVDDLIEQSEIPTRRVLSALTMLELDGFVQQHSGKRYTRAVTI